MKRCLYGTVYNNVNNVRDSVKSFFSPIYDKIVIVDSFSTDGTYETLKEIEGDYNLTVLRYRSTRGKGRDYALRHCPDNSVTAYVDLDAIYNRNLEKLISLDKDKVSVTLAQGTFVARKETILNSGGWKDLYTGEDLEMVTRVGIEEYLPLLIGENAKVKGFRENRYATSSLRRLMRTFNVTVDYLRASYNLSDLRKWKGSTLKYLPFYVVALAKGRLMNDRRLSNAMYEFYLRVTHLRNPQEYGFSGEDVLFHYPSWMVKIVEGKTGIKVDEEVRSRLRGAKETTVTRGKHLFKVFYYSDEALERLLNKV
ncbi:MAG: glycosyltransferase family 2 protein [Candidatus Aramenus sp.]|jgi:glycosyltransferase involved in cell wall biosynthesis|nr:glycosyltransferase family 2 protein [Candidatus Aramenus sp.]